MCWDKAEAKLYLRIPVAIIDDDCVCCRQGDALPSCPGGQQENKAVLFTYTQPVLPLAWACCEAS